MKICRKLAMLCVALVSAYMLIGCQEEEPVVIEVTGVEINVNSLELMKGKTAQLVAVVVPSDAADKSIEWESSDSDLVSVNEKGAVTALEVGSAVITARHNEFQQECRVTVLPIQATGVALDQHLLDMKAGDEIQLTATVAPDAATDKTVEWISTADTVATVDAQGKVIAKGSGEASIVARIGDYTDECKVYVVAEPCVGDYYYADGQWFSEPLKDELPVGIIFYLGDPTVDDEALKADFPGCTHGLVMSVYEEPSATVQPNSGKYKKTIDDWAKDNEEASKYISVYQNKSGEYLNKIVGYNNTKVFELFNQDEANADWPLAIVDVIHAVRERASLPEGTSGWYIPSIKELSLMCNGEYSDNIGNMNENTMKTDPQIASWNLFNEKLLKLQNSCLLSIGLYVSSTESDIAKSMYSTSCKHWAMKMEFGCVQEQYKNFEMSLRPVFAF